MGGGGGGGGEGWGREGGGGRGGGGGGGGVTLASADPVILSFPSRFPEQDELLPDTAPGVSSAETCQMRFQRPLDPLASPSAWVRPRSEGEREGGAACS